VEPTAEPAPVEPTAEPAPVEPTAEPAPAPVAEPALVAEPAPAEPMAEEPLMRPITPEGQADAVQERGAAPLDAREQTGPSAGVREGDTQGGEVARAGEAEGQPQAGQETAPTGLVEPELKGQDKAWVTRNAKPIEGLSQVDAAKVALLDKLRDSNATVAATRVAEKLGVKDLVDKPREELTPAQQATLDRLDPFTEKPLGGTGEVKAQPSWMQAIAAKLGAKPVFSDGDRYGLVQSISADGAPRYFVATADGGFSQMPVSQLSPDGAHSIPADKLVELKDAAVAAEAHDKAAFAANPDGPFAGGKTFVAAPDVPPEVASYVQGLQQTLGLKSRVLLVTPESARTFGNEANGYFRVAGGLSTASSRAVAMHVMMGRGEGGVTDHAIMVRPTDNPHQMIEATSHEVGHMVEESIWKTAPAQVTALVTKAWREWKASTAKMTFGQLVDSKLTPEAAKNFRYDNLRSGRDTPATEVAQYHSYWTSFPEWFADQTARWATTADKPVSLIDKFFAHISGLLNKVYAYASGKDFLPTTELAKWLDSRVVADPRGASDINPVMGAPLDTLKMTDGRDPIPGMEPQRGSIPDAISKTMNMAEMVNQSKSWLQKQLDNVRNDPRSLTDRLRNGALGWFDVQELKLSFDHHFGGALARLEKGRTDGRGVTDRLFQMNKIIRAAAKEVAKNPQANGVWDYLRAASQIHGLDYRKSAKDQPEAFEGMDEAKDKVWKAYADDLKRQWDSIAPVAEKADDLMRAGSQAANNIKMNLTLQKIYRDRYAERNLPAFALDPTMEVTQHVDMIENPQAVADATRKSLNDRLTQLAKLGAQRAPDVETMRLREQDIVNKMKDMVTSGANKEALKAVKDEAVKTHEEVEALVQEQRDLAKTVKTYKSAIDHADQVPFFHLGRDGDHFVSMKLLTDATGALDPRAVDALRDKLTRDGFDRVVADRNNENNDVYIRVPDPTQREALVRIAKELSDEKLLAPNKVNDAGVVTENNFRQGEVPRLDAEQFKGFAPSAVERLLEQMKANTADLPPEVAAKMMSDMRSIYVDMLPKSSMVRLFEPRQGVMGFNQDMTASHDQYMTQFANAAGRMWSQPHVLEAVNAITKAVSDVQTDINAKPGKVDVMTAVAREIMQREKSAPALATPKWMRGWLQANHLYFLGLSPAYTVELMTQIPTLLLPELGRKYGFLQSAQAIGKSVAPAMKVVKALMVSGHGGDGILTPTALRKAGLNDSEVSMVMSWANKGWLELGGWTKATMSDPSSISQSKMVKYMLSMTVASEVLPRVMAAFAAHDLHTSDDGVKARMEHDAYVGHTIGQSMYNWQTDLQARNLGAGGFAGPITPLVTKFMSFQTKMLARLYREMHTAILDKDATPEDRAEARRFLAGHLAAVTTLAGSLGLPVLPVAAGAASSLANFLTGSDQYDAETWYRSHLSDIFGPQMAEVMAKGLPRAFGMDLSEHAGEDRLLPFSDLLTDKRKWSDALQSAAWHSLGSPFSLLSNVVQGGTDLVNGRTLKGAQELLPTAVKNPFRAWRMSQYGYEDNNGVKLPIPDPSAADIAMQVVGITPRDKASDQETTEALQGLQDRRAIVGSNLKANLVTAYNHKDQDALQSAMGRIMMFNQDHPSDIIDPGQALSEVMHKEVTGQAFGSNNFNPDNLDQWRILRAYGGMPARRQ
jgi:hypothetical protein